MGATPSSDGVSGHWGGRTVLSGISTFPGVVECDVASTFDFTESFDTRPADINTEGKIVGSYIDAGGVAHGFLVDGKGFDPIDFPGATETVPTAINDQEQVVGHYTVAGSATRGFISKKRDFDTVVCGISSLRRSVWTWVRKRESARG